RQGDHGARDRTCPPRRRPLTGSNGAAIRAAKDATPAIPIVMIGVSNPMGFGLVGSLGRPSGNVTGTADFSTDLTPKRCQLLKEVAPSAIRVAYLGANFTGAPPNPSWMQTERRCWG